MSAATAAIRCIAAPPSTGHFSRKADPVDAYVAEVMVGPLFMPGCCRPVRPAGGRPRESELIWEADRIRRKLDGLAALYEDGTLTAKGVRRVQRSAQSAAR